VLSSGKTQFQANKWYTITVVASGTTISASINGVQITSVTDSSFAAGFAALGSGWNFAQYDNFHLNTQLISCGQGNTLTTALCCGASNQQWDFYEDKTIRSRTSNTMCMQATNSNKNVILASCNPSNPSQQWVLSGDHIYSTSESSNLCLDIFGDNQQPCTPLDVWQCKYNDGAENQQWYYDIPSGQLIAALDGYCISATN